MDSVYLRRYALQLLTVLNKHLTISRLRSIIDGMSGHLLCVDAVRFPHDRNGIQGEVANSKQTGQLPRLRRNGFSTVVRCNKIDFFSDISKYLRAFKCLLVMLYKKEETLNPIFSHGKY